MIRVQRVKKIQNQYKDGHMNLIQDRSLSSQLLACYSQFDKKQPMKQHFQKSAPAYGKVEPDFTVDISMVISKQKRLKLYLQQSISTHNLINYDAVKHKDVEYNIGDFVELWDTTMAKPYVGKLTQIVEVPHHLQKLPFIEVQWCLKMDDLPASILDVFGQHISVAEVFPSNITQCLYVESIKRKCFVLSEEAYGEMTTTYEYNYFSRSSYNTTINGLIPFPLQWKRLCSCDSPINPDREYVQCGKCESWFHVQCVKNYNEENTYTCDKCNLSFVSDDSTD